MNPYEVLGLQKGASFEEIRSSYKKLAKSYHPDRLHNVDEEEKKRCEEHFKKVTVAYQILVEQAERDDTANGGPPTYNWASLKEVIMHTFVDVATKYMQRKEHFIKVPVSIEEFYSKKRKKLQLFLKGVEAPIILEITCDRRRIKTDVLTDDNDVHHIQMELQIKEHPVFKITEDDTVYALVAITWKEYITGKTLEETYVDGTTVSIAIPPFVSLSEAFEHPSGKFMVEVEILSPSYEWWSDKSENEKELILNLLDAQRTQNCVSDPVLENPKL